MELERITITKFCEMFVVLLVGMASYRLKIFDSTTNKKLSALLLKIVTPAMIISSYQMEFQQKLLSGLLITTGLSLISFILVILMAGIFVKKKNNPNMEVEKIAVIYSNCGFVGIPLISAMLGKEGVFYMTAYITVLNILIWSHGFSLMNGSVDWRTTLSKFVQPATIGIMIGLILFLFHIILPEIIAEPLSMIGGMNASLAMMVAGATLAERDILAVLKRKRSYWISTLKLLAAPLVTLVVVALANVDHTISVTILVASACPAGAIGTMFALQYNKDSNYASELFAITTVLSLITLPVILFISGFILR